MKPELSIIICTHNRANLLSSVLNSMVKQNCSKEDFEVIIIDNASNDNTKAIIESFKSSLQNLQYIYEPSIGLSFARNAGLKAAIGQYVAFLDDDAKPCEEWAASLIYDFENLTPRPVCIAGKVIPLWEAEKPKWYPSRFESLLGLLDFGNESYFLGSNQAPIGANMAFIREVLVQMNGFSSDLGRKGKNLLSNEEIQLFIMMHKKGYPIYYEPKACVEHLMQKERLTKKWLIRRLYWQGISDVVLDYENYRKTGTRNLIRLLRVENGEAIRSFYRYFKAAVKRLESERISELALISYRFGKIRTLLSILLHNIAKRIRMMVLSSKENGE